MGFVYNFLVVIEFVIGTLFLYSFSLVRLIWGIDWSLGNEILYYISWTCVYLIHYLLLWKGGKIKNGVVKALQIWEFVIFGILVFEELVICIVVAGRGVENFLRWETVLGIVLATLFVRRKTRLWHKVK